MTFGENFRTDLRKRWFNNHPSYNIVHSRQFDKSEEFHPYNYFIYRGMEHNFKLRAYKKFKFNLNEKILIRTVFLSCLEKMNFRIASLQKWEGMLQYFKTSKSFSLEEGSNKKLSGQFQIKKNVIVRVLEKDYNDSSIFKAFIDSTIETVKFNIKGAGVFFSFQEPKIERRIDQNGKVRNVKISDFFLKKYFAIVIGFHLKNAHEIFKEEIILVWAPIRSIIHYYLWNFYNPGNINFDFSVDFSKFFYLGKSRNYKYSGGKKTVNGDQNSNAKNNIVGGEEVQPLIALQADDNENFFIEHVKDFSLLRRSFSEDIDYSFFLLNRTNSKKKAYYLFDFKFSLYIGNLELVAVVSFEPDKKAFNCLFFPNYHFNRKQSLDPGKFFIDPLWIKNHIKNQL